MTIEDGNIDNLYQIFHEYNSFVGAKGVRRVKAVEWAAQNSALIKSFTIDYESDETLLHKIGWNTFIGLGFYSAIFSILKNKKIINSSKIEEISNVILEIINDIIQYTNIGNYISMSVELKKNTQIPYAKVDDNGNIFIYPDDAEKLFNDLEEIINA